MKLFLLLFVLLQPLTSLAVYRCESQGNVTYADIPCPGSKLDIPNEPSAPARDTDAIKKERGEVHRLQKMREQRERQDQQIRDLAARGAAARERKCRSLALQVKWREEDVRESTLDKATKAKKQLRRAIEKFDSECR